MLDVAPGGQAGSATQDLGSAIGGMLGDFDTGSAPDEQADGADAGAPPAEASPASSESSPTPVVTPDAEPTAEAVSAATPATPDTAAPEVDPLASSTPLTYSVNGQERTMDGIRILGDEAVITKEALPDVIRRLGERDNLYEQSQQYHQRQQHADALAAWKHTASDGTESLLTGNAGLVEMRVSHARLEAALETVLTTLSDPARLPNLVALDEQGNIVLNQAFVQNLLTQSELSEMKAEQATRNLIGQLSQTATQAAAPAPNFSQFAPAIIQKAAGDKLAALSAQDQQALGQQMLRYIRPTTAQERRDGHGAQIVDAEFTDVVQQWVGLRQNGATAAVTATKATASNAARLAAARQGSAAKPAAKAATPTPPRRGETDHDRAWAARERAAAGRLARR